MSYKNNKYLSLFDAYFDKNEILFANNTFNALMRVDREKFNVEYIDSFEGTPRWTERMYRCVVNNGPYLFFFPNCMGNIARYNLMTREINYFQCAERWTDLAGAIVYHKNVWMIPKLIEQPMYLFNMESGQFVCRVDWNEQVMTQIGEIKNARFIRVCSDSTFFWTFVKNTNIIIRTSLESGKVEVFKLDEKNLIGAIATDGYNLFLSLMGNDAVIVKWHWKKGILNEIILKQNCNGGGSDICHIACVEHKVITLPAHSGRLFIIDSECNVNELIIPYRRSPRDYSIGYYPLFGGYKVHNRDLYLFPDSSDRMYILHIDTGDFLETKLVFDDVKSYYENIALVQNMWKDNESYILERPSYYHESLYENIDISDFVQIIGKNLSGRKEVKLKVTDNIGRKVYTEVRTL